jgi:two-component system response regulator NreC
MPDETKVMIVDDHAVVRSGLKMLIDGESDLECVGDYPSHERALPYMERLAPDVVIMDLETPGAGGIAGTEAVLKRRPDARVLVLSMHESPDVIKRAFAAGAAGYVAKAAADEELIDAIRVVADGGRYLNPSLGAQLASPDATGPLDDLSAREREVLRLLALGHTNHEIADQLVVSVRTVESHRAHIMRKLRAETRAEMVRVALRSGLLDDARREADSD